MNDYERYKIFKNWTTESFGVISHKEMLYFNSELQLIDSDNLNNKVVLEMGFGNGSFSSWAIHHGCNYFGFELIPELINRAKELGVNVFDAEIPFEEVVSNGSVDYIFAWDVFEHFDNEEIGLKLLECYKVLKSGGRLVARVPSGDSPFSGPLQYGDFTHKTSIGSLKVKQYALGAGFNVESIRPPAFPLWGMGVKTFLLRTLISILRKITYYVLSNVFMGGDKLVLTQNLVFVLKKP